MSARSFPRPSRPQRHKLKMESQLSHFHLLMTNMWANITDVISFPASYWVGFRPIDHSQRRTCVTFHIKLPPTLPLPRTAWKEKNTPRTCSLAHRGQLATTFDFSSFCDEIRACTYRACMSVFVDGNVGCGVNSWKLTDIFSFIGSLPPLDMPLLGVLVTTLHVRRSRHGLSRL